MGRSIRIQDGYRSSTSSTTVYPDNAPNGATTSSSTAVVTLMSYAALRAYTGSATYIRIAAPVLAGDFWCDTTDTTTADNGGTILVDAANRRWKRIHGSVIDVKWFGAVGDLVFSQPQYNTVSRISGSDPTAAIHAALAYCGSIVSSDKSRDQAGNVVCFIPEGDYQITSTLSVPPNVVLHAEGWLYNFISSALAYVVQGQRHSHCRKLQVHANAKTGVLWGETGSAACASNLDSIVVWHAGVDYDSTQPSNNQKVGLRLRGLDFRLGHVWVKGGNIGLHGDGASDVMAASLFLIGSSVGIKVDSGEQWSCPSVCWDTNIVYALAIDNSNNIRIEGEAFVNSDAYGTPMQAGVVIGQYTSTKACSNIRVKYAAQSTGGYGAMVGWSEDCVLDLSLTNSRTFAQTSGGGSATSHWSATSSGALLAHNIGTQYFYNGGSPTEIAGAAIKYLGNSVGYLHVRVSRSSGIANLTEGTVYGTVREGP